MFEQRVESRYQAVSNVIIGFQSKWQLKTEKL